MKEIVPRRASMLKKSVKIGAAACAAVLAAVTSSFAALADLFNGVNVSGVDTNVTTIMVAFVGIGIMYFGYKLLRKLGVAV